MQTMATITSKRQFTIPVSIFRKLNLKEGQKVIVREENGAIKIEKAIALVDRLAGSVEIPHKFKGLSLKEIKNKAKKEYFQHR